MKAVEKQPRVLSLLEANLEEVKKLNEMIKDELISGTRENSLVIRQMKYQREKYLQEINTYLQKYEVSLVMA
ncbi:MAG: hypothetical protein EAZ55_12815 [Cytophagales bacterium]|nr:MAG: hypothetical protein EAZ55_12815 [Cytophagales bacterium]